MNDDFDRINGATGFATGDQVEMFGRDAVTDEVRLSEWADRVASNRWHMA